MKGKEKAIYCCSCQYCLNTPCNSQKYCNITGGREAMCLYCDKRGIGQFRLPLPSSLSSFPRFRSWCIPNASDLFPMSCLTALMKQNCRFLLSDWSNEVKHWRQLAFLFSQGILLLFAGPMSFSFRLYPLSHLTRTYWIYHEAGTG